ncbi:MAG: heavy-metal-associated domain-containing protein [Coriobacteriales bacterium]|jgi:copper chaperone CopZ|nr:heavy-metal-associated domain-containing protein [Coriobacteriales bacterium]
MAETTVLNVEGMHCQHCVKAVTDELTAVPGVSDVQVNLEAGNAVVVHEPDVARSTLIAAVDEAGFDAN